MTAMHDHGLVHVFHHDHNMIIDMVDMFSNPGRTSK